MLLTTLSRLALAGVVSASAFDRATVLNYKDSGAICKYMSASTSKDSSVSLYIDSVDYTGRIEDLKIPVMVFHYPDVLNFSNVPAVETYFAHYVSDKTALYSLLVNENGFDLKPSGKEYDADELFNGIMVAEHGNDDEHNDDKEEDKEDKEDKEEEDKEDKDYKEDKDDKEKGDSKLSKRLSKRDPVVDVHFKVTKAGFYCVYVAPPTDVGIVDLTIPVTFKQSYGHLSYISYIAYSQLKWVLLLAVIVFGYLSHYVLRYKIASDFSNLASLSLISRAIILYVIPPFIAVILVSLLNMFLQNHFASTANFKFFFALMDLSASWLNNMFDIELKFFILLFSMGYGVVYYSTGANTKYRRLPPDLTTKAFGLLFANVGLVSIALLVAALTNQTLPYISGDEVLGVPGSGQPSRGIAGWLFFIVGLFPIAWSFMSIFYYFKTKKVIDKFPPVSNGEQAASTNERIVSSFRKSILVIFVLPVIVTLITFSIVTYRLAHGPGVELPAADLAARANLEASVLQFIIAEQAFRPLTIIPFFWTAWANYFLTVILLFAIWIKDNNGLVLDPQEQTTEYSDVAQYDIESDTDEPTTL